MYLGKIVETGPAKSIFENPLHPYTRILIEAVPIPNPLLRKTRKGLDGEPPSPVSPPSGCRFHPRCPRARRVCREVAPVRTQLDSEHQVACHLFQS